VLPLLIGADVPSEFGYTVAIFSSVFPGRCQYGKRYNNPYTGLEVSRSLRLPDLVTNGT